MLLAVLIGQGEIWRRKSGLLRRRGGFLGSIGGGADGGGGGFLPAAKL